MLAAWLVLPEASSLRKLLVSRPARRCEPLTRHHGSTLPKGELWEPIGVATGSLMLIDGDRV